MIGSNVHGHLKGRLGIFGGFDVRCDLWVGWDTTQKETREECWSAYVSLE